MYWLLKTEPEGFSWDDQVARGAKGEPWTGVRNFRARSNLKKMQKGEHAFFYHTGKEKQAVGIGAGDCVLVAGTVKSFQPLPNPVTLAAVKADARFKDMALVKYSRLSVQPVTAPEWKIVCHMAGKKG